MKTGNAHLIGRAARARSIGSKGVALAVLATAQLVIALDYSIVNIALPDIGRSLGFPGGTIQWVISAYALTFGGLLLLGGRAARHLNYRQRLCKGCDMTQTTAAAMTNTTITGATNRTITGTRTGGWWSRRPWLGMFLGGLGLWMATVAVTFVTQNPNLVPTIILLGSFLVPVTFVADAFGRADQVVTTQRILTAFVYGGALGVLGASVLEAAFLKSPSPVTYLYVGLIEEAVKLAALWLVARRLPRYSMRDGIVLGAAVGFGFAAFESAGFAFNALFTSSGLSLINVVETEVLRGILAPVGHGLWDAAQPIAVWLTLVLTGTQVQWQLLRLGQVPAVTQTQVHLFTFLNWGLLIVDALIGLWVLRGRWRQVTTPDRREPTAPDRPGILAAVVPVSAESRQQ